MGIALLCVIQVTLVSQNLTIKCTVCFTALFCPAWWHDACLHASPLERQDSHSHVVVYTVIMPDTVICLQAQVMRQQLRELSMTSQGRPGSSKPSMTHQVGHSPLSISSANGPAVLGHLQLPKGSANLPSGLSPNKPGSGLVQPSSPSRLWPGSTPPLHPASPTRATAALISPVQRSAPSKGGLKWGRWGKTPPAAQPNSPLLQSSDPSKNWGPDWGSPLVQSSSPSRNWGGPEGHSLVQSSSPSRNWAGPGGPLGVQSSSPSRLWCVITPGVQSSAPSFLKGWLSKQRGHSVVEEQAMEVLRLLLTTPCAYTWYIHHASGRLSCMLHLTNVMTNW